MVEGFERFCDGNEHAVWVSTDVGKFLEKYEKTKPREVRKVLQILKKLSGYGREYVNNTEQFKREGSFPNGKTGGASTAVYVVKAYQLRVYGGFVTIKGKPCFLCIEAAQKQKNKANRDQLVRVAKALGANDV